MTSAPCPSNRKSRRKVRPPIARILIVNGGDPGMTHDLCEAGYHTASAVDRSSALAWIDKHVPILVILDLSRHDLLVLGLVQSLEPEFVARKLPVLALLHRTYDPKYLAQTGLTNATYLVEPFSLAHLIASVQTCHPRPSAPAGATSLTKVS